jgi:DNA mismatch repair protein MutL
VNPRKPELFPQPAPALFEHGESSFGRVLTICEQHFALLERQHGIALLNLDAAEIELRRVQLLPGTEGLRPQPLLIPVKLTLSADEIQGVQSCSERLKHLGIDLVLERQRVTLRAVPLPLRHQNLPQLIPAFLSFFGRAA